MTPEISNYLGKMSKAFKITKNISKIEDLKLWNMIFRISNVNICNAKSTLAKKRLLDTVILLTREDEGRNFINKNVKR